MSTYAVGDLQGCYDEFRALLDSFQFDPSKDHLWLVGDLINRGPKNLETLNFIRQLGNVVTIVLGNHDLHFMAVARGFGSVKKSDTFQDILADKNCADLVDWLRTRPLVHYDADLGFLLVHAGVPPIWPIKTCLERAKEVEDILKGDRCDDFFKVMYGNNPESWDNDLGGMDRIRIITNYFTRIRYCTEAGKLELLHKTQVQPEGYKPWFQFPRAREPGETMSPSIVFGHWAALEGKTHIENIYALDTGCVWGKNLTAMRLEDRNLFSVPSK